MNIVSTTLDDYVEYMKLVSDRIRGIKTSVPIIQNELNIKQPKVKLEVGSGLIPVQVIPTAKKIARVLVATKLRAARHPRTPSRNQTNKRQQQGQSSSVMLVAGDIAEAVVKSLFKK